MCSELCSVLERLVFTEMSQVTNKLSPLGFLRKQILSQSIVCRIFIKKNTWRSIPGWGGGGWKGQGIGGRSRVSHAVLLTASASLHTYTLMRGPRAMTARWSFSC